VCSKEVNRHLDVELERCQEELLKKDNELEIQAAEIQEQVCMQ
jgi:hypothetical protein